MSVHDLPTRRPPRPTTDTRETVPAPSLEVETIPAPPVPQASRRRSGVVAKIATVVEEVVLLRQADGRRER